MSEYRQKIIDAYNKAMKTYEKVLGNKKNINQYLSDFVLGSQLGAEVYGVASSTSIGEDVNIPQDISVYDKTIQTIKNDVADVDTLLNQLEDTRELFHNITVDEELAKIFEDITNKFSTYSEERSSRQDVLNRLINIRNLVVEQQEQLAKQQRNNNTNTNTNTGGSGGGYGGGGGSGGGGGGGSLPPTNTTPDGSEFTPDPTARPPVGDYSHVVSVPSLQDPESISNTAQNLAQHEVNVGSILGHVVVNGVAIGADVYPIGDLAMPDSDIGFDFMALQMALDYVDADIEATKALITQIGTEIENNNTKIAENQAKLLETVTVTHYDRETGTSTTEEVPKYDNAALQSEIDELEKTNEELQKQMEEYQEKQTKKEGVFDELISVRNAYNSAYDGLTNVFTAASGLDAVSKMGSDNTLYGVKLTDNQLKGIFNNLGTALQNGQGNLSLKSGDGLDLTKGEFSLDNFNYLVSSCLSLGKDGKSFSENLQEFIENDNNRAQSLNSKAGLSGGNGEGFSADSNAAGNQNSEIDDMTSTIDSIQGQISTTLAATKHIVVDAQVGNFLTENSGNCVVLPATIRSVLGLQTEGLLSIPAGYSTEKDYPFVYWLVGTGHAAGTAEHLKTASFAKSLASGRYHNNDALIYVPSRWGNGDSNNSKYNGTMLNNDLHNLVTRLNVDQNRISGTGTSIGAYALAYLVTKNPDLFSTVAFTGGGFEGPWGANVSLADAIKGSPNTTFIWYMANNDETSHNSKGEGVHTYTMDQHRRLVEAGINSVYYEIGGSIWHTNACDRFASNNLLYDLTHIQKGQQLSTPTGIQQVSAETSAHGNIDHGDGSTDWYRRLSS